jgi:hypothetical protein
MKILIQIKIKYKMINNTNNNNTNNNIKKIIINYQNFRKILN